MIRFRGSGAKAQRLSTALPRRRFRRWKPLNAAKSKTPGQNQMYEIRIWFWPGVCFRLFWSFSARFSGVSVGVGGTRSVPFSKNFSKKYRLARPRLYNAGAFCICAHAAARGGTSAGRRQVFRFENLARSMRRNSPPTARADDQEEVCHALRGRAHRTEDRG